MTFKQNELLHPNVTNDLVKKKCRKASQKVSPLSRIAAHFNKFFYCPLIWIFYLMKSKSLMKGPFPASIYLLKVNNRNTRTRCGICPKLTIKTLFTLNMQLPTGFRIVTNDNLSDFKTSSTTSQIKLYQRNFQTLI